MRRRFPRHWLRASAALLLLLSAYVVPACAQQPEPPTAREALAGAGGTSWNVGRWSMSGDLSRQQSRRSASKEMSDAVLEDCVFGFGFTFSSKVVR
jgi:hypothetical protein